VTTIERHLTDKRGLVYRYRYADDGLRGDEGTFLLCTFWCAFWLAHVHALAGDLAKAGEVFERAAGCSNDLGLLSKEVDPRTSLLLGNSPQAFSHLGLLTAAWAISQAGISHSETQPRPPTAGPAH
jgi:alpha,alpha-trehalase